jgi:hypothetical protein
VTVENRPQSCRGSGSALALPPEQPAEVRFVTGDPHDHAPNVRKSCGLRERILVATRRRSYPHTGTGVEVRRIFHKLCSLAIGNFNEHFRGISRRPENNDRASPDSNLNGCVRPNDMCKIYVIAQLDLDSDHLGYLSIRTRGCKAGYLTRES